jgi:hypothetical protein
MNILSPIIGFVALILVLVGWLYWLVIPTVNTA